MLKKDGFISRGRCGDASGFGGEEDGVPAGLEPKCVGQLHFSGGVPPANRHRKIDVRVDITEADVNVGAALARVAAAAIDQGDAFAPIGQMHGDHCAYRRPGAQTALSMTIGHGRLFSHVISEQDVEAEELSGRRCVIVIEERWSELVRDHKVEPAIAIDVGGRDAAADHWFGEAELRGDVVEASVVAPDEEWIAIVSAEVRAGLEVWPEARVMNDLIVARAERLEFGPAVDFSFDETHGLDRFEHAVVVEVREPRVPAPTAAREAELFRAMNEGRDAVCHSRCRPVLRQRK